MIKILYTKTFLRRFKKFDLYVQDEAKEKIELFKDKNNHKRLQVHKLKGKWKDFHAFSINRKDRILFEFKDNNSAIFHDIGDHDIYN